MVIKELKKKCYSKLSGLYPITEIDSFFFILMDDCFNLKRVDIALQLNEKIQDYNRFLTLIDQLADKKPIQYLIGKTSFFGLDFKVNNSVLIPRPETEELAAWIINDTDNKKEIRILDIGTGSGCIAISLANELKQALVSALDISNKALIIAKENASLNNVNISFIEDNILNSTTIFQNKFDVIVSNPPYVRKLEKVEMDDNVLNNEPHLALFVSNDNPLLFYSAIANFALKNLHAKGKLYFEINQYLGNETVQLLKNKGFKNIILKKDIFNNNRMIRASI